MSLDLNSSVLTGRRKRGAGGLVCCIGADNRKVDTLSRSGKLARRKRFQKNSGESQTAPEPLSTAGMVCSKIWKSSHRDHLSMYCRSSSIHFSKEMELLP